MPPAAAGALVLDVREPDEYEQGAIPGALFIPRGKLESNIENRIPDKDTKIVIHCASAASGRPSRPRRSPSSATPTSSSVAGGFNKWKDEGRDWAAPRSLTADQRNRYQRHLLLPEVDIEGQLKLLDAKVLLLGAGGLGSPAALYLAAAGVGTIGIIDMDVVDESNLQRQILHNMDRIGDRKVDSAKKTLTAAQPRRQRRHLRRAPRRRQRRWRSSRGYDIIVDGTDNFPTRYLVNDASVKLGIPVVHGSIFRFEGMVTVFDPKDGPTYRDMVPEPPPAEMAPSCAEAGVLGVLPGIIGSIQADRDDQADPRPRRLRWSAGSSPTTPSSSRSGSTRSARTRPTRSPGRTATRSRSSSSTSSACRTRSSRSRVAAQRTRELRG